MSRISLHRSPFQHLGALACHPSGGSPRRPKFFEQKSSQTHDDPIDASLELLQTFDMQSTPVLFFLTPIVTEIGKTFAVSSSAANRN